MRIVDCFPFFAPTGRELLKLRINLYKDKVDKFVIVESNKTHSGKSVPFRFEEIAKELNLPMDKIIYIPHHIHETEYLEILPIDRANAAYNQNNLESVQARARERMQKDAVMQAAYMFDDNDIMIYGDIDEIINPIHIEWCAKVASRMERQNYKMLLRIPIVFLQGKANLRVWDKSRDDWYPWNKAVYMATKKRMLEYGASNLRCGNVPLQQTWPQSHGKYIPEMGWHFAWMGTNETRKVKASSFAHAHDKFKEMEFERGFEDKAFHQWLEQMEPKENEPAPGGNSNHFLKSYPVENLPSIIFEDEEIRTFLGL